MKKSCRLAVDHLRKLAFAVENVGWADVPEGAGQFSGGQWSVRKSVEEDIQEWNLWSDRAETGRDRWCPAVTDQFADPGRPAETAQIDRLCCSGKRTNSVSSQRC